MIGASDYYRKNEEKTFKNSQLESLHRLKNRTFQIRDASGEIKIFPFPTRNGHDICLLINASHRNVEIELTFPSNSDDPGAGFMKVCIDAELDSSSTELRSTRAILEANSSDKLSSSESSNLLRTWNTRLSMSVKQNNLGQYPR